MKNNNNFRFYVLLITGLVILGVLSLCVSIPVTLQTQDGSYTVQKEQVETDKSDSGGSSLNLWDSICQSFKNFLTISGDFINTVKGGESNYDSGFNVLIGQEDINGGGSSGSTSDTSDTNNIGTENSSAETAGTDTDETSSATTETPAAGELVQCTLSYVVDGDTLVVTMGNDEEGYTPVKVRLIGIDTPESVHADESKNTVWGTYASDHTKYLLEDTKTVWLEYDEEQYDQYGRILAYVWLDTDTSDISDMLNARILMDGYAMDKVYQPNTKYADRFSDIRKTAQENGTGLWNDEGFVALWDIDDAA